VSIPVVAVIMGGRLTVSRGSTIATDGMVAGPLTPPFVLVAVLVITDT